MIVMNQATTEKYMPYPLHGGGMKAKGKRINWDRWAQWNWLTRGSLSWPFFWPSHTPLPKLPPPILATAQRQTRATKDISLLSLLSFIPFRSKQPHATSHDTQASTNTRAVGPWCLWCQQSHLILEDKATTCKHCGQVALSFRRVDMEMSIGCCATPIKHGSSYRGRVA